MTEIVTAVEMASLGVSYGILFKRKMNENEQNEGDKHENRNWK